MRFNKTMMSSLVVSAAAAVLASSAPSASFAADEEGKAPKEGRVTSADARLLKAEAAARKEVPAAVNADFAAINTKIRRYVKRYGTDHTFGSYVDATTGVIVVETDAPRTADKLVATERASGRKIKVRTAKLEDNYSRKSDIPSYWGGAGVTASVGSPWCTTGFTVQNGWGTRFQVTAGHCFSNGTNTYTENGGQWMGSVSGNGLSVGQDMELIGGSSYWGYIYTGGVDSSTGMPVVGAGDPVVGYSDYCHSGRTTGENCGHTVNSVNAQVCTQTGCKYPVIAFTGGVQSAGGDSGSPFYVKSSTSAWARGIIIAGNGTTSYAEKWSRIAFRFGVSITTG